MINYRVKQVLTNDITWWAALQEGEKRGFIYAETECYLQPNTVRWHCAWANHYLQVTWWSLGNERKTNLPRRLIYCTHTKTCVLKSCVVSFHTQISWHKDSYVRAFHEVFYIWPYPQFLITIILISLFFS